VEQSRYSKESLLSLGLSEKEANLLMGWIAKGKPGVAQSRADDLFHLYLLGYSCQDIHDEFPAYDLPLLLYARVQHSWDERRRDYKKRLSASVLEDASATAFSTVKTIMELVHASSVQMRRDLMRYLENPEKNKPPEFLPRSPRELGNLVSLLKELTAVPQPGQASGMWLNVNINNPQAPAQTSAAPGVASTVSPLQSVNARDVKASLLRDAATIEASGGKKQ